MTMTRDRIEELKRLAEALDGAKWSAEHDFNVHVWGDDGDAVCKTYANLGHTPTGYDEDDVARYIAAANPQTVLSLLALAERALEPQGQALPVVAWLTEWPKDRLRSAGKLVELVEPEQKFAMNHYEPLVRLSDARAYASQLAIPAGLVPEGWLFEPKAHGSWQIHAPSGLKAAVVGFEKSPLAEAMRQLISTLTA
ncbi:hypothetical protein [Herbaspirillum aquaticum]|uniref:Uncharacterized protein n=1 Tax=Herbaspirillum aquaticum TaxID=568783 RepID=A0A225SME6_9BURK|nr:hypothetical protein [Herbaspirillum aquaticum]OWY31830.1 hypothetical protein CEJ45_24230 [Herbaspirillum aquaticum]